MIRQLLCIATIASVSFAAVPTPRNYTREEWRAIEAKFIERPRPEYPVELRRLRLTGSGLFRLYIDTRGEITGIRILKSTNGSRNEVIDGAGGLALRSLKEEGDFTRHTINRQLIGGSGTW